MKLSASDKRVLTLALDKARSVWEQSAANYGVIARARPGAWPTDRDHAAKKEATVRRRLLALERAAAKLDL